MPVLPDLSAAGEIREEAGKGTAKTQRRGEGEKAGNGHKKHKKAQKGKEAARQRA
jgi:hypothetical protein